MEEEILQEIEAVKAVYGSDCEVLHEFPPHLKVSIKPRTAEDLSQQFVEAVLVIKANTEYPIVPPEVELINLKGLDDKRHLDFLSEIQDEAKMLASSPMLVALCEEAIDRLTNMNHPEGNCSFCLFPLVMEGAQSGSRPFMKLMSCFHCFHSDCFGRWWRWLQEQNRHEQCDSANTIASEGFGESLDGTTRSPSSEADKVEACHSVNCPVCRKVIHIEDIKHVRQFLQSESNLQENDEENDISNILSTEEENKRRETFEQMLKVQHNRGAIIEPKKLEVILPGMFLPGSVLAPVESLGVSDERVPLGKETNFGQDVIEPIADISDLPSSSKSSSSLTGTEEVGDHVTIEGFDVHDIGTSFGRRGERRFRRHGNQQSHHKQKHSSRKQTVDLPKKGVWIKKE